jgi:hypothetical protein
VNPRRTQLLGTGLWDDQRIFADTALGGGWYPAPDSAGFQSFSTATAEIRTGPGPHRDAVL